MAETTQRGFIAAAIQLTSTADLPGNLAACRRLCSEAAGRGAQLAVLPECFAYLGEREGDKLAVAEVVDPGRPGPILEALIEIARAGKMWLVAGGMPERLEEDRGEAPDSPAGGPANDPGGPKRVYNTALVLSPDGQITAAYRKMHLFDVAIPGRAVFRESDSTAAGAELVAAETPFARLGLSICYDVRFPELYRQLTVDMGANVILVPAAFTAHTGAAHWHTLLRARAIENQCFVIAAAQVGRHNPKRECFGHSQIIDPWGTVIAEVEGSAPGLAVAEIDLAVLEKTRAEMPCLTHHRLL